MKSQWTAKKLKITIIISAVIMVILSFFGGYFAHYLIKGRDAQSVSWIISVIEKNYCVYDEDTGKIKEFDVEDYAETLVALLDKYSEYYTAKEYSDVISTSKGNNYGLGLAFLNTQTDCKVFRVIGNSPADKAGFKKGDQITRIINGTDDKNFSDCDELLTYLGTVKENQEIQIFVLRDGIERQFNVKKQVFITSYVAYYDSEISGKFSSNGNNPLTLKKGDNQEILGLDINTAYISFAQFEGGASEQMEIALNLMKERGRTKLILDLRDNGGGYMNTLSEISSHFVYGDNGKRCTIAIVKDRNEKQQAQKSNKNLFNTQITDIVVLANENTASASECLIGAMLYYKRAFSNNNLVIEKNAIDGIARTYGKGIMQTTFQNIYTGEALKLTTAYVFLPDGKTTIHGKGFVANQENSVEKGNALSRAIQILQN